MVTELDREDTEPQSNTDIEPELFVKNQFTCHIVVVQCSDEFLQLWLQDESFF